MTSRTAGDPANAVMTSRPAGDPANAVMTSRAADPANVVMTSRAAGDPANAAMTSRAADPANVVMTSSLVASMGERKTNSTAALWQKAQGIQAQWNFLYEMEGGSLLTRVGSLLTRDHS